MAHPLLILAGMEKPPRFVAHRAFAHPLWVGSLLLLLVNDHLLKGAGVLPGWLTGKLSDFAGLFLAPALLAALLGVRSRRGFFRVHVGLGVFFAALKLWEPAARGFEGAMGWLGVPARVVVDPTDLLALPALLASFWLLAPLAEEGRELAPRARSSALLLASFGCVATSAPVEPMPPPMPVPVFPPVTGALGLGNDTGSAQVLRVRELKASVELDCDTVASSPSTFLHAELFAPASTWLVEDQRVLPLRASLSGNAAWRSRCQALLIDGDRLDPRLVFWMLKDYPERSLNSALSQGETGSNQPIFRATQSGEKMRLEDHKAVYPAPSLLGAEVPEECLLPPPEEALAWSTPLPHQAVELQAVTISPDGCVAMDFPARRVYLCGSGLPFPFKAGDTLAFTLEQSAQGARLTILRASDGTRLVVGRGSSALLPAGLGGSGQLNPVAGCVGQRIECGGLARPAELPTPEQALRSGDTLYLDGLRFALLSARYQPVYDGQCTPSFSPSEAYIEWAALLTEP